MREAEVRIARGETIGKICRSFAISEQTYYRREYGGLKIDQTKRLKDLVIARLMWAVKLRSSACAVMPLKGRSTRPSRHQSRSLAAHFDALAGSWPKAH